MTPRRGPLKRGAQALLAGGGIVYGVMVPAYFFEIFEQKRVAQAAYDRIDATVNRNRQEIRDDFVRALESIERKMERIEAKVDRIRR